MTIREKWAAATGCFGGLAGSFLAQGAIPFGLVLLAVAVVASVFGSAAS